MFSKRVKVAGLAIAAALGLSACSDYGYGGMNMGYGSYYGDPYFAGGGFGNPYWGWNDGFFYPGTGYYVYDNYRRPFRWSPAQQRYWEGRRQGWRGPPGGIRNNWRDFRRDRPGWSRPGPGRPGYGRPGVGRPDIGRPVGRPGMGRPDMGRRPEYRRPDFRRDTPRPSGGERRGGWRRPR